MALKMVTTTQYLLRLADCISTGFNNNKATIALFSDTEQAS
jgi:hypothetical protein